MNGHIRSSILDHIYTLHPHVDSINTEIGDHVVITCGLQSTKANPKILLKRNWRHYRKNNCISKLNDCMFETSLNSVQETWSCSKIILLMP